MTFFLYLENLKRILLVETQNQWEPENSFLLPYIIEYL